MIQPSNGRLIESMVKTDKTTKWQNHPCDWLKAVFTLNFLQCRRVKLSEVRGTITSRSFQDRTRKIFHPSLDFLLFCRPGWEFVEKKSWMQLFWAVKAPAGERQEHHTSDKDMAAPPTRSDWQVIILGEQQIHAARAALTQPNELLKLRQRSYLFDFLVVLVAFLQFLLLGCCILWCRLQDAEGKTVYAVLSGGVGGGGIELCTLESQTELLHKHNMCVMITVWAATPRRHEELPEAVLQQEVWLLLILQINLFETHFT